ncbi:MAG: FMN-binding protein [Lacrimispora sp.]|uniref:FMN-binding protein n=1 Tax=Lacrimispora sp. TaxID=2719234 RepID=UPI0039E663EB
MRKKRYDQVIGAGVMCILSLGTIFTAETVRKQAAAAFSGIVADISGLNGDRYQVRELHTLADGSYVVYGTAKGFAGDIETAVVFNETGEHILNLAVTSHGETAGIGTKATENGFLSQFQNVAAPVKVADLAVLSPVGGTAGTAGEGRAAALADKNYNPAQWNPEDTSPEAKAMRILYETGLLKSSYEGERLETPVADLPVEGKAMHALYEAGLLKSSYEGEKLETPVADLSAEGKSRHALYDAGLLASSIEGEKLTEPFSDLSAEEQAALKLEEAGLAVRKVEEPAGEPVTVTDVDAVSGATISSKAVAATINNGYFFLKEEVLK